MDTWIIVSISQNPFDYTHSATNSKAHYMWILRKANQTATTESSMSYSQVVLLMKHFRVKDAAKLAGKSFKSERDEACSALNLLLVQISHGGKYIPPSHESLVNRAAESLAKMEEPDFTDVDDETVFAAFSEAFKGMNAKPAWLKRFMSQVKNLSGGKVRLVKVGSENFSGIVMGPAEYMMLVSGERKQRIVLGPYSTPVSFDN